MRGTPWEPVELYAPVTILERVDGVTAQIDVTPNAIYPVVNNRIIVPGAGDVFGIAAWLGEHLQELREVLGVGTHTGEWYGAGINRNYGLDHRRFALYNVERWCRHEEDVTEDMRIDREYGKKAGYIAPETCGGTLDVVAEIPLYPQEGSITVKDVPRALYLLSRDGSYQVPGFMQPEGVLVYHKKAGMYFKGSV